MNETDHCQDVDEFGWTSELPQPPPQKRGEAPPDAEGQDALQQKKEDALNE